MSAYIGRLQMSDIFLPGKSPRREQQTQSSLNIAAVSLISIEGKVP
jgi:hypothetical protein